MSASKIEWTERSDWNPIRGCTRVSEGCRHCYAEQIAGRFSDPGQAFHGFAERTSKGGRWTGKVALIEERLTLPLGWRKPALIFASSTSDIFHESMSDDDIDRIFAVMALAPQHRFQVLTKRAERMLSWFQRYDAAHDHNCADFVADAMAAQLGREGARGDQRTAGHAFQWPLPNVWLGVSVEDQAAADERIPHLLATPAAVRFLSCEPLLGPVDLTSLTVGEGEMDALRREDWSAEVESWRGTSETWEEDFEDWYGLHPSNAVGPMHPAIDWVIAGGESGREARPMHPDWARALRDQCAAAGVPFFFKQWGEWQVAIDRERDDPDWRADYSNTHVDRGNSKWLNLAGGCGFHGERFHVMRRVGKRAAGRLLDGVEHSGMPQGAGL